MKIIFFVENGNPTVDDFTIKSILTKEGNKVYFSNGSISRGFEDSCDKVVMSKEFPHIVEWCKAKGIPYSLSSSAVDMVDAEVVEVEEKPKEEKPAVKRGRKPKVTEETESDKGE